MQKFERIDRQEMMELCERLYSKTLEEITTVLGPPSREFGPSQSQTDAKSIKRGYEFTGVGKTVYQVTATEMEDGTIQLNFKGKPLADN
ncbi:MAG: hypothetical protein JWQ71_2954 [Pedosphaera sp.]|nr:hypothetical protein [Pedosphaera sp.]